MYAIGDSVVAGLVPATSRRCCGRVSICEISVIALMCGKNAIPRVGGRHQAGHYTATKIAYLHGLYPLRRCGGIPAAETTSVVAGLVPATSRIAKP